VWKKFDLFRPFAVSRTEFKASLANWYFSCLLSLFALIAATALVSPLAAILQFAAHSFKVSPGRTRAEVVGPSSARGPVR
jgi:hypothetical protein